jgi:SAM-dependent methyltransferase
LHPDAEQWNARYRREKNFYLQRQPHKLVTENSHLLPPNGIALEAAAGVSPLASFLTERNLTVIALDVSHEALLAARQRVSRSPALSCAIVDLTDPWLPAAYFDVIFNFYFLSRPLLKTYRVALKPGGILFFETFAWAERPGSNPLHYVHPGELEEAFADWTILYKNEYWKGNRDGEPNGQKAVQLIAQKPLTV